MKSRKFNPKLKMSKDLFTEYLLMRYPKIFVDTMILYFDFPEAVNYATYVETL